MQSQTDQSFTSCSYMIPATFIFLDAIFLLFDSPPQLS